MKDGFIKVGAASPLIFSANITKNCETVKNIIDKADKEFVNLLVFPELCITGASLGDLFLSDTLLNGTENILIELKDYTKDKYPVVCVGLPLKCNNTVYDCVAVIHNGEILGIVPKKPNFNTRGFEYNNLPECDSIELEDEFYNFGTDILFKCDKLDEFTFAIANDKNGAVIIADPSVSPETVTSEKLREIKVKAISKSENCAYIFSSFSGDSTQGDIFSGHSIITENGKISAQNKPFENNDLIITEIDVKNLCADRRHNGISVADSLCTIAIFQEIKETGITRKIERYPFVPSDKTELAEKAAKILQIQSFGLAGRIRHTYSKKAVIGISGGLDSTLALLVAVRAMKILNRSATDILAITMPCFGTTKRTRSNSEILCRELGVDFKEINITDSVKQHFKDIGQSENDFDVTYENSQARERTQVLMDIANKENGIVIGTGDLSELALGWATYNGDHMSMYGVNADLPKTLIRHIVRYEAENSTEELKRVLLDILDTPVSPELLPADSKGDIAQKTEDLVGPYDLHDFFLYHTVRHGASPQKIFSLACLAFEEFDEKTILHWLTVFTKRFFTQQFKRSCLPDGPRVGSVSLSPRGDWQMPSDASYSLWLSEIEKIKI